MTFEKFRTFLLGVARRFAIATAVTAYAVAVITVTLSCERGILICYRFILVAPIFLIYGQLPDDDGEPWNPYLLIVCLALVATTMWTLLDMAQKAFDSSHRE